jgi:hypothetical protein
MYKFCVHVLFVFKHSKVECVVIRIIKLYRYGHSSVELVFCQRWCPPIFDRRNTPRGRDLRVPRALFSDDHNISLKFFRILFRIAWILHFQIIAIHETNNQSPGTGGDVDTSVIEVSRMNEDLAFSENDCLSKTSKVRSSSWCTTMEAQKANEIQCPGNPKVQSGCFSTTTTTTTTYCYSPL